MCTVPFTVSPELGLVIATLGGETPSALAGARSANDCRPSGMSATARYRRSAVPLSKDAPGWSGCPFSPDYRCASLPALPRSPSATDVRDARLGHGDATLGAVRRIPTAPVAAASLIVAYAVAVGSGSRPLGGVVLAIGGLWCIRAWRRRHGTRTAVTLACVGFGAFVVSHLLALAIGAWPSVLIVAAIVATVAWTRADTRTLNARGSPRARVAVSRQTAPARSRRAPRRSSP